MTEQHRVRDGAGATPPTGESMRVPSQTFVLIVTTPGYADPESESWSVEDVEDANSSIVDGTVAAAEVEHENPDGFASALSEALDRANAARAERDPMRDAPGESSNTDRRLI